MEDPGSGEEIAEDVSKVESLVAWLPG